MLDPDLKHRTVLGWQIRWVAGLFCLLTVAAGSIPAVYATEFSTEFATEFDREFDSEAGVLAEAAPDKRVNLPEACPSSVEYLHWAGSSWQPEVETEETDVSPSLSAFQLSCLGDTRCTARNDERFLSPTDTSDGRFSRAPPLA